MLADVEFLLKKPLSDAERGFLVTGKSGPNQ